MKREHDVELIVQSTKDVGITFRGSASQFESKGSERIDLIRRKDDGNGVFVHGEFGETLTGILEETTNGPFAQGSAAARKIGNKFVVKPKRS